MSTLFDSIAETTGFQLPELFRRMTTDGVTDYTKNRDQWQVKPPALYMVSNHVEWWDLEGIANWAAPDYYALAFVPFAANGAGDLWSWHPASGTEGIVFVPHDEDAAEHYAPDFEGFLFRHIVQGLAEIYEYEGQTVTPEQHVQAAQANVNTLAPYLRPAWVSLLNELTAGPLEYNKAWRCFGFLKREEAKEIVARELAMPNLGKTFPYQT
jgi:hypothetical protein